MLCNVLVNLLTFLFSAEIYFARYKGIDSVHVLKMYHGEYHCTDLTIKYNKLLTQKYTFLTCTCIFMAESWIK